MLIIPPEFEYTWDFSGGLARGTDENGIDLDGNYVWREKWLA
jgi:hypothetical protein